MYLSEYKDKLTLIALMAQLITENGESLPEEEGFVKAIGKRLDIPESKVNGFLSGAEKLDYRPPRQEYDRIFHIQALVFLALTGHGISAFEQRFLVRAGFWMGLRPGIVESVIATSRKHYPEPVPVKELKEIYNLYKS